MVTWRQPFDVACYACKAEVGRPCKATVAGFAPELALRKPRKVKPHHAQPQEAHSIRWFTSLHGQRLPLA